MKYLMLLLAVSLLVAGSAAADVTVTFQQGVGGYTGTVDTWVTNQAPDDNTKGASAQLQVKNDGGQIRQTLVRFDSVFGSVVPTGVTIQSATLTVVSDGGSGGGTYLHKMLVTWSGTSTYNTLVSGVDDPGEYDTTPISTNSGVVSGTPVSYDVKSVVQAWSNDPASNFGFVWLSQGASHYFRSSEYGTATDRPLLTVTFSEFQITAFAVQGALTGSSKWTDSATVYVTLTATTTPDATVTGYLVTETSATPALADPNWQPSVTSYTILAGEGIATLYAWAKDDQDRIAGKTAVIGYSTTSPAISDVVATAGNEVLKVTWTTNASAVGWVEYGPEGGELSSATSLDYGTSHSATITGLTQGVTYDYVVHSNGAETDLASATTRLAQTITWDGNDDANNDGNWSVAANWNPDFVPAELDTAVIPTVNGNGNSGTNVRTITVDKPATIAMLSIPSWPAGGFSSKIRLNADLTTKKTSLGGEGLAELDIAASATFTLGDSTTMPLPVVTGTGKVVKLGTGTVSMLAFGGSLGGSWLGTIEVREGMFNSGGYTGLGSTSMVTVFDGATFECGQNWDNSIGQGFRLNGSGVSGGGALKFSYGGVWYTNASGNLATDSVINVTSSAGIITINGPISGAGSLTKAGPGKLILGGSCSYAGTVVSGGTLQLLGSIDGDVTVKSGATLKGVQAQIDGTVTVEPGGTWDQTVAAARRTTTERRARGHLGPDGLRHLGRQRQRQQQRELERAGQLVGRHAADRSHDQQGDGHRQQRHDNPHDLG